MANREKGREERMDLELSKIKLIIWDLDDTFWKGTLSEGSVVPIEGNILLIEQLTKRGIVNAICSKNDCQKVKSEFSKPEYRNTFSNFVFNSINWMPKGERIKKLISDMNLKDDNVLFIDDNISNLQEAKYCCQNIQISLPDCISQIKDNIDIIGKKDESLSHLKQYKILEKKCIAKEFMSSNSDFLKNSNIKATIHFNCLDVVDKLLELINHSKPLNYTKICIEKNELETLLKDDNYENTYITACDKYGDYGIIGFSSLNKDTNTLKHFVFACRTVGMGIDQEIYKILNYPNIEIIGEVSGTLSKQNIETYVNISYD